MVDLKQTGSSKWMKAKMAIGFTTCLYAPRTLERQDEEHTGGENERHSTAGVASTNKSSSSSHAPPPPSSSSGSHRLSKSGPLSKSGKRTCAICLTNMKAGQGHAIFTAECSHSFHFHCITSNVKHGNQICPVCRAKWKEVPFQSPRSRTNNVVDNNEWMNIVRRIPPPRHDPTLHHEPAVFNDDEPLGRDHETVPSSSTEDENNVGRRRFMEIETYPEFPAVSRYASHSGFSVLIHLKAPHMKNNTGVSRAPIDLITVLDTSGSMAGTKLALLKRAMGFVIQNLGPSDRLSVVTFSSSARRLFPLRCMTDAGKKEALQSVNSLLSNGGTNIAEGLRKGAKLLLDRKWKNPVGSVILLSDGQDTYTVAGNPVANYKLLLPASSLGIPVHTFGFGGDHDAAAMHSIAESSGGTFSFIEAEGAIQDAFAQCIGGLLSVVVQELKVEIECLDSSLRIHSVNAGSYRTSLSDDDGRRTGSVDVGDLYAEEERDILVTMDIPVLTESVNLMSLLKVKCSYKDPITKKTATLGVTGPVTIKRPEEVGVQAVSIEVDRQRNRLRAAEAMAEARLAAEKGELSRAVAVLESCRKEMSETASVRAGDRLCNVLCSELREMQERMASRRVYETSGRAYVLSGMSSHLLQRATARGDSTDGTSFVQSYQTPSMVDMVTRSQTVMLGKPSSSAQRKLRPALSFPVRSLEPR
ncbi:E3 ubiquitin-protein ligase WAV3 [Linum grandiflorum]